MAAQRLTDKQIINRLWRDYIRPHLGTLLAAFVFMIIVAAATAAYTWLIKFIVDSMGASAIPTGTVLNDAPSTIAIDNAKGFVKLVAPAVIGLTFVSGVSLFIQSILANKVALNVVGSLQKSMFASLQNMDFARFGKKPVGDYVSHFTNDVNVIAQSLLRTMSNLVRELLTLVFLIIAMIAINWQLSLIILVIYPIAFWPIIHISKRIRGSSHQAQAHMGQINSMLNESLGGSRMVRSFGLETSENKRLGHAFDERIALFLKLVTNKARVDPILEVLTGVAIAGVLAFGVYQLTVGTTTAGSLVAVLTALGLAAPKARALGTLNNVIQEGLASLHRIFDIIDDAPTIVNADNATVLKAVKGDIEFNQVDFSYAKNSNDTIKALSQINLRIPAGKTTALVGPSGGGKSTLMNLLIRLYDVSQGAIKIDGHDIRDVDITSLRANIALVSQDITLFDDSVAHNIGLGRLGASHDQIIQAAKAANAHDFIEVLPNGYETIVGQNGDSLSGGQRQRIALARAFLKDAPILLLDEATSALDAKSEALVQESLDALAQNRTVIVIAHRLSTVRRADEILVLDGGEIVEQGDHETLMRQKGLYAKLRALQFSQ